jgi:hypothetical protein
MYRREDETSLLRIEPTAIRLMIGSLADSPGTRHVARVTAASSDDESIA